MKKYKILAIDDETGFTDAIKEYFTPLNFEVFVAGRGDIGLAMIVKERPDIVLLDLKMPSMEGDEVLMRMKDICPDAKPIIITAYNDNGKTKEKLLNMGAAGYFDKPISSLVDLEKLIVNLLK